MRGLSLALMLILVACDRPAREQAAVNNVAAAATSASPLIGQWKAEGPVRLAGEDVRTETSDAQVDYRAGGIFRYRARLSMAGGKLPAEGLSFRVDATGRWRLEDAVLTERFDAVTVEPERPGQSSLNLIAEALADEMKADEPSRAEVVELTRDRLVLRERESAQVVTYSRQPQGK